MFADLGRTILIDRLAFGFLLSDESTKSNAPSKESLYDVEYTVVFRDLPKRDSRIWSLIWNRLKPGFRHVELWKRVVDGAWLRFDTSLEFLNVQVYGDPPQELMDVETFNPTYLEYRGNVTPHRIRQPFRVGPVTCVELAAALLGVRLPFYVRTPYQLYKFLKRLK